MTRAAAALRWVLLAPLRLVWWLLALPFRLIGWVLLRFPPVQRARDFLNFEPEDHPIADALSAALTSGDAFIEHIEAVRVHLKRSLIALVLAVGLSFVITERLVSFLAGPVGGLQALKAIEVTESISVFMRVALLTGLALALPYIAFELWLFAAPGVSARSRRMGLVAIPLSALLFVIGMVFAYFILLPAALPFLLNFMGIQAQLRPDSYFRFVTGIMFWIGLAFEFPLVVFFLTGMGLVRPQVLASQWRLAVVVISVLSAAITPTIDPVNMGLVMGPMILLYFLGVGLGYLADAARRPPKTE